MESNTNKMSKINRGMQLTADLPDIMPGKAGEKLKLVYKDIHRTLRVPIVNLIFRTLANYPEYFVGLWEQLNLSLRTQGFEQTADNLR